MTQYTVRVQIRDILDHSHALYTRLHQQMEQRGLSRKILGENGVWYHMPSAEYNYVGYATAEDVRAAALAALAAVGVTGLVLVTESVRCVWELYVA